ncbi:MAG: N-acetyl-gamma-glutamyl-phosphate reductase [Deltaproteobacteria bacterium]|nr:N-acetyl-gamma-glutamyl-phosphate reductase [Deltaproteobacteria bacterium]MBN2686604.1 N-acetyl-gamma-glutamyl-phosphate reductase [Deltaproteobacteria bacterium]
MITVGIYGGSGYTGQELMKILIRHDESRVIAVTSRKYKGMPVADVYPIFRGLTEAEYVDASPEDLAGLCDVVFLAVPHGEAMEVAPLFLDSGTKVIDLSADYRLRDINVYESWYKRHTSPHLIDRAVYGLPELYRDDIVGSDLVANPGCYPTGVILGLAPILKESVVDASSIIVDSKSGVSGAGREPSTGSLFCEVNEGFKAYKIGKHRHTPEINQELSVLAGRDVVVTFVPHLIPVNRGILSTSYATLQRETSTGELIDMYKQFYRDEQFVRVADEGMFPNISSVKGSNYCDIGLTLDERTGRVIIVSSIDNLIKGASGQAVQNMNIMCGLPEDTGLKLVPLFP